MRGEPQLGRRHVAVLAHVGTEGERTVGELARELGLSNKETLDLCSALGIGVKSHSSSIEEAQADRVRRKAEREGLKRDVQPVFERRCYECHGPKKSKGGLRLDRKATVLNGADSGKPVVIPGQSARFWNVRKMPTREIVEARVDSRSRPSNVIRPVVGL